MQGMSEATFKRTLYIDNLPPFYVEKDIRDYIESHAFDVGRIALFRYGSSSKNWGCSKGHALVVLKDEEQALSAIPALDGKVPPNAAFLTGKEESGKKGKVRQMKLRVTPYRPSKRVLQPSGEASPLCVSELRYPDLAGRENSELLSGTWEGMVGQGSEDMDGSESPPAQPATPVGQHYPKAPATDSSSSSGSNTDGGCRSTSTSPSCTPSLDSPNSLSEGGDEGSAISPSSSQDVSVDCAVSVKLCAGLRIKTSWEKDGAANGERAATPDVHTPDHNASLRRQPSDVEATHVQPSEFEPSQVEALQRQLLQKELALEELTLQLAVEKTECMRLEDEWSTAQVKADELQSTADELLQQNAELRGEIRGLKAELAKRAALTVQYEDRIENAKDRITKLVQDKSILSTQLCGAQQQLHVQEDKIAHLQQELVSLKLVVWQQVLPGGAGAPNAMSALALAPFATGG